MYKDSLNISSIPSGKFKTAYSPIFFQYSDTNEHTFLVYGNPHNEWIL